jgi:hypothetical protein
MDVRQASVTSQTSFNDIFTAPFDAGTFDGATEADRTVIVRGSMTVSDLLIEIPTNTQVTSSTVTSRKNSAAGAISISVAALTTGTFEDLTNSDSLVSADTYSWRGNTDNLGLAFDCSRLLATYTSAGMYVRHCHGRAQVTSGTATYFCLAGGAPNDAPPTTESSAQSEINTANTYQHLIVRAVINGRAAATTCAFRQNAATAISVSITGSTTGNFEETATSISVAAGDDCNFMLDSGGGAGTLICSFIAIAESGTNISGIGADTEGRVILANETNHLFPSGYLFVMTETGFTIPFEGLLSNVAVRVSANTVTATSTLTSRINSSAGTISISIGASATGLFEDETNTDTFNAVPVTFRLVTGATGTSMTLRTLTSRFSPPAGAGVNNQLMLLGIGI